MRQLLVLFFASITISAFSQVQFYTDFDNYSFNPALVDHDHKLQADVFYQSDFADRIGGMTQMNIQSNYWVNEKNNVGLTFSRFTYGIITQNTIRANYVRSFRLKKWKIKPSLSFSYFREQTDISKLHPPIPVSTDGLEFNILSTSIGLAADYSNLSAGFQIRNIANYSPELDNIYSTYLIHLGYKALISRSLEINPVVRASAEALLNPILYVSNSLKYKELASINIAYHWNPHRRSVDQILLGGLGLAPRRGFWISYQHAFHFSEDYNSYLPPTHHLSLSFNLPNRAAK